VHRYGAHLFHTSNATVWEYVNRFTTFTTTCTASTNHKGVVFPLPINLGTINQFFQAAYTPDEARRSSHEQAGSSTRRGAEPRGARDRPDRAAAVRGVHPRLHGQAVADRSEGAAGGDHQPSARALHYDNRYFNDTWEGLPTDGYTAWLERMADHPNIEVKLSSTSSTSRSR
jgi:UDP-galactopyranose mutase